MTNDEIEGNANRLLEFLWKSSQNRGIMADLKRGLNEDTQNRAWPHIASFCDLRDNRARIITQTVAAGFAICGESMSIGNLGLTMKKIAAGTIDGDGKSPYDAKFRRLLSSDSVDEICGFLPGIIKAAQTKSVSIDFNRLYKDLWYWGTKVKLNWANAYWGTTDKGD